MRLLHRSNLRQRATCVTIFFASGSLASSLERLVGVLQTLDDITFNKEVLIDTPGRAFNLRHEADLGRMIDSAIGEVKDLLRIAAAVGLPLFLPDESEDPPAPQLRSRKTVERLEHREIKLPTNPDVAEVWNAVQGADPETLNVVAICKAVAKKRGCNAKSLRVMFNRWRRMNIG